MYLKDPSIKIALGLNNCVDFEMKWDSKILEKLIVEENVTEADIHFYPEVCSKKDLIGSILYYVSTGAGAGVRISTMDITFDFVKSFEYRVTLGGAGVRASIAISKLGYKSLVHLVSQSDTVRKLLPADCEYYCGMDHDEEYPHLIIQFPDGAEIHANGLDIVSNRANRIMYFNDRGVMELPLSEDFFKAAGECKSLLIGGYTSVTDHELAMERATTSVGYINKYLKDSVIYYEDSCPPGGIKPEHTLVWQTIVPSATIYGMNEDELQQHTGRTLDLLDPQTVVGAIEALAEIIPCRNYLIHSKFWSIIYGQDAKKFITAAQNAVDVSTTRLLNGDDMSIENIRKTQARQVNPISLEFKAKVEAMSWKRDIAVIPAYLVTEKNLTTIGLGDSFVGGFLAKLSDEQ